LNDEDILREVAKQSRRVAHDFKLSADDVVDITQTATLHVFEQRENIHSYTHFKAYAYAVVKRAVIDTYRKWRLERRFDVVGEEREINQGSSPFVENSLSPEETLIAKEEVSVARSILDQSLKGLDPQDLEILSLVAQQELPSEEIAASLGISPAAVRQRLSRMRRKIAKHLVPSIVLVATKSATTAEEVKEEVERHLLTGASLILSKTPAAPEVEQVYARAWALCEQLGTTSLLAPALGVAIAGLSRHQAFRAEHRKAAAYADEMLHLAERLEQDRDALLIAHLMKAQTDFFLGNVVSSLAFAEQGRAFHDMEKSEELISLYGVEPKAGCFAYAALASWWRGNLAQALAYANEGRSFLRALNPLNAFGTAFYVNWLSILYLECGNREKSQLHAEEAMALSQEHGFPFYVVWGKIIRGYCIAEAGGCDEGLRGMLEGLRVAEDLGVRAGQTYFLALLSKVYRSSGDVEEGLKILSKALAFAQEMEERIYEPELYRLKGELLLAQDEKAASGAEAYFHQAIETAQRQKAKSLELRATMSLGRLWQRQGKQAEARHILSEVYGWFTEGFETKDLREARQLLAALS